MKSHFPHVLVLAAAFLGGCTTDVNDQGQGPPEDEGESNSAIIGGTSTYLYPAVGVMVNNGATGCSASLVAPNVILVAGHCFGAGRTEATGWEFEIRKSATQSYRYPTGQGWVNDYGGAGENDVALLRLEKPVPSSVAKPLALAKDYPAEGNTMRMLGFGCTVRGGGGAGTKRSISFAWGENKDASCPGDSGGALIAYPSSQIVGVISGWNTETGDDMFGWVPKHYDTLTSKIAELRE